MMQAFRNSAKPLIWIVAIAFFAWLVLDLSGLSGGPGMFTTTSVGKINGRTVESRAFQEAVSRMTEQRQRQSAEPLGLAEHAQIRDQVWERFIQEHLLEAEFDRYGISVSSEELTEVIRNSPPSEFYEMAEFQTEGQFDPSKYQRWLASAVGLGYVPLLEEEYRSQILQAKLARHLVAPLYVSDAEVWQRFRDEEEQVRIGEVPVPVDAISDGAVTVTPSEVDEFYAARRDEFRREPSAFLSYIMVDRRPVASDTAAARARVEQLRQEIQSGTPFEDVARRESADTVSGREGGDLGEWTRGSFVPEFEAAAFSLPLNRLSDPVPTAFGYHLIEITARSGDKATGRHILIPIEVTGEHRDRLDARADSLEVLAADRLDPASLDIAARALGLPVQRAGPVVKGQPGAAIPDAAVWAFRAEVGEHSPVIETPSTIYVFRLDSLWEAGTPPLGRIRDEVAARLLRQKKLTEARRLAQDVSAQAAGGKGLEQAARDLGLGYTVAGPFSRVNPPPLGPGPVGAAFSLAPGQVSGPIEGPDGFHVIEVLERIDADSSRFVTRLAELRQQVLQGQRQLFLSEYFAALRGRAKIVDNRDRIYRTEAQIAAESQGLP